MKDERTWWREGRKFLGFWIRKPHCQVSLLGWDMMANEWKSLIYQNTSENFAIEDEDYATEQLWAERVGLA